MQFLSVRAKAGSLWIMLVIFTPLALALDWIVLDGFWWQHRAEEFPSTTATVTQSEITEHRRSRGRRSYSLHLEYTFLAEGGRHTASRMRYYSTNSSRRATAKELQERYPVGRTVIAHYPPDDPALAVLEPGVQGIDWLRLMAAVAGNLLVVGGWGLALTRRRPFFPDDPHWLTRTDTGWVVHLPATTHRAVFIISFAVLTFFSWIFLPLSYGENPEPAIVGVAFAIVGALSAFVAALVAHYPVLAADLDAKELVLPAPWLGEPIRVPFRGISSVEVRWEKKSAGRNGKYIVYHCDVGWGANGRVDITTVATFLEESQAQRLALWLRLNCGLAKPDEQLLQTV